MELLEEANLNSLRFSGFVEEQSVLYTSRNNLQQTIHLSPIATTSHDTQETSFGFHSFAEAAYYNDNISTTAQMTTVSETIDNESLPNALEELQNWAVIYNVNENAVSAILDILKKHTNLNLPKDCRTLLKTPRKTLTTEMGSGRYCHFGLENAVKNMLKERKRVNIFSSTLNLLLNVDGLPISKSSTSCLWPILCLDIETKKVSCNKSN